MQINQRVIIKERLSDRAVDLRRSRHPDRVGIIYAIDEDAQNPYFYLREDTDGFACPLGGFSKEDLTEMSELETV